MNKANYTDKVNFPLSTQGLDFIQQQILLAAEYAKAAGGNYILSGCETSGNNVNPGTLIINGELYSFGGGTRQTKIRTKESSKDLSAGTETYTNAYQLREVEFGANLNDVNTYDWGAFQAFPTNKFLLENSATKMEFKKVRAHIVPKGAIMMWSGSIADIPNGFALCDGKTVNGVATPNLSGRFVVGYKAGADTTTDVTNSTNIIENYGKLKNTGGKTSIELKESHIPPHTHSYDRFDAAYIAWGGDSAQHIGNNAKSTTGSTGGGQAHENRPPYYVLAYIIKVYDIEEGDSTYSINANCNECSACEQACIADAIYHNGTQYQIDQNLCIGCASCYASNICPLNAITKK